MTPSSASTSDVGVLPSAHATRPRRILLAWEHGRNLGHLSRLGAIAGLLAQSGTETAWAVPPAHLDAIKLGGNVRWYGASPHAAPTPTPTPNAGTPVRSFADVLAALGFVDETSLRRTVESWLQLFKDSNADGVVLDYAPAAQLAALLADLPAAQITNGFDAPPPHCPVFGIDVRGPMLDRRNAQQVAQLDRSIDSVARSLGRATGSSLNALLRYPTRWYDCTEEADPYGPRSDGVYVGPTGQPEQAVQVDWPEGAADAPKVFVYLRDEAQVNAVLQALGRAGARVICAWPGASASALAQRRGPSRTVVGCAIDLSTVLQECDTVVNYGSTTLVNQALLAGKPQLMLPTDVEKWLVARRVAAQRTGIVARWPVTDDSLVAALHGLLHDPHIRGQAVGIRERQRGLNSRFPQEMARFVHAVRSDGMASTTEKGIE